MGRHNSDLGFKMKIETFNVFNAMRHLIESDSCFKVDIVEAIVFGQKGHIDPLETSLAYGDYPDLVDEDANDYVMWMDSFGPNKRKHFKSLRSSPTHLITLIEKPPVLKGKQFPSHLRYAYLGASSILPAIISSNLSQVEEEKLLRVLREPKEAIGWSLADIKGIRPSM